LSILEYRLDDLGWSEFEKLCQALLKARLGVGVEAWGGRGDWGNDAYCGSPLRYPGTEVEDGPFQFQVKFVEGANAAGSKPRAALIGAVKLECKRVKAKKRPSPRVYSLLTNVVPSPQLRETIQNLIRDALPKSATIVIHGGNDVCSWLHLHEEVVRMFPQLLSHRDLSGLVTSSLQQTAEKKVVPKKAQEFSSALKKKRKLARAASRKHNFESALRLWREARQQAEKENNKVESISARLEIALILTQEGDVDEALELAEGCLREAEGLDLGEDRGRLLQVVGEIHRALGNNDIARGFATNAQQIARSNNSLSDEGFALVSLSMLEPKIDDDAISPKKLGLVEDAYNIFAALYAAGDDKSQETARQGFAACHRMRAEMFGYRRQDEALVELTREIEIFQDLGEAWKWEVADALLRRADLRGRVGETETAVSDLNDAAGIFQDLENALGLAKCHLQVAELLDFVGKRDQSASEYERAAAIAATSKNVRRSSYFLFRHACKLFEQRHHEDAERIFLSLWNADWLEPEHRLTVISQLCFVAQTQDKPEVLKERCSLAVALIDDLIKDTKSSEDRCRLLMQKGQHLEHAGLFEDALECFNKALERHEAAGDQRRVLESWFQIRGVASRQKDRAREREASEKVLALAEGGRDPMLAAMTLASLAQLNIEEQRYKEASEQLNKAEKLDPRNPLLPVMIADLRTKLPQFWPHDLTKNDGRPPARDFPTLIEELRNWANFCPKKRKSVLAIWYYIHKSELWDIFSSMLGVKFLVVTKHERQFELIRNSLDMHGDLFVWGTNFVLTTHTPKSPNNLDVVPVPKDFLFPAGVTFLARKAAEQTRQEPGPHSSDGVVLSSKDGVPRKPYYVALLSEVPDASDPGFVFVGRKQSWADSSVIDFMLGSERDFDSEKTICLPIFENSGEANLRHTMEVAWQNGAIPVFPQTLPNTKDVVSICDTVFRLPSTDIGIVQNVKEAWEMLLATGSRSPKIELSKFDRKMRALRQIGSAEGAEIRVYQLRFEIGGTEVVHPAVVIRSQV